MPSFKPKPNDAIRAGTMNLTLASAGIALIGLICDAIPGIYEKVLGNNPSPTLRATVFLGIVLALTLIVVADFLSRGYAFAHRHVPNALPLARTMHADREDKEGTERPYWEVVAMRTADTAAASEDGAEKAHLEFLVAREDGRHADWVAEEKLVFRA